jgi:hypothetical protein
VPQSATFVFVIFVYVIASIADIHPVYCRIWTHDLLDVSLHPYPLDQASDQQQLFFVYLFFFQLYLLNKIFFTSILTLCNCVTQPNWLLLFI